MWSKYAIRPSKQILNSKEKKALLQPLKADGFTSDEFNKIYGKGTNPYTGTDRDRNRKKKFYFISK